MVTGSNEVVSHLIYAGSDIMVCLNFFQDPLLQVPVCFQNSIIDLSDWNLIKSVLSYNLYCRGAAQGFEVRNSSNRTNPPNRVRICLSKFFCQRQLENKNIIIKSLFLRHVGTHEQEATTANFINSLFGRMSLDQALDLMVSNISTFKGKFF